MKYRLGLDLGVASIGSAIIELDDENNPKQIIDTGVRIFEVSEGAADRRAKRTARKNYKHTKTTCFVGSITVRKWTMANKNI